MQPSPRTALFLLGPCCFLVACPTPDPGDGDDEPCEPSTWHLDADGDGYGNALVTAETCEAPAGYVAMPGDCDESDESVHPGAGEPCDGIDNDCDGETDELDEPITYHLDGDGDGWGRPDVLEVAQCEPPDGYVTDGTDCDDEDPAVHPGAEEVPCDEIDQDCDGSGTEAGAAVTGGLAFDTIQEAIDEADAVPGATVWVCPGIHLGQIAVHGGQEVALRGSTGIAENHVLDGEYDHTILVLYGGSLVTLDALTFEHGEGELWLGPYDGTFAGAIYSEASRLRAERCVFADNHAYQMGTVYAHGETEPTTNEFSQCRFEDNSADSGCAALGIYSEGGTVSIEESTFTGNAAHSAAAAFFMGDGVSASLVDSLFTGNWTESSHNHAVGTQRWNQSSIVSVDGCVFADNETGGLGLEGDKLALTLTSSTFSGNLSYDGGAIQVKTAIADIDIEDSVFSGNAAQCGGAIELDIDDHATVYITGSTFSGNEAVEDGGAIYIGGDASSVELVVQDTEIDGNVAGEDGGGIYAWQQPVNMPNAYIVPVQITITGGAVTANQGGGVSLNQEPATTLQADCVDWGTGPSDNTPFDVDTTAVAYDLFTTGEVFICVGGGDCQ